MHYSKPSTWSKPFHTKQTLTDSYIRKKVKTDSKEPKFSHRHNDENKLIEEPIAPSTTAKTPLIKPTYSLPHTDWNWNIIKQKMQPIAEGRCTVDEILKIIEYAIIQKSGMKEIDLSLLRHLFNNFGQHNRQHAEEKVLPCIAKLVIRTPELFPNTIPLMVQGTPERVRLSKEQCACLLANMFMGTIIKPKTVKVPQYYNFLCWYYKTSKINEQTNIQKLACLYYYFSEIANGIPERYIIFERLVLKEETHGKSKMNDWRTCTMPMKAVVIHETGKMEDSTGTILADFANHFLGGFVLTPEIAQEEILFTITPECMVGILFSEQMLENEAILIQGVETYCKYTGYRKHFRFAGPANQNLSVNQYKVLDREIVAIDALNLRDAAIDEFSAQGIIRELNKAYIGFNASDDLGSTQKKPVATGRWGCGVFQANVQLKFLLQWAAASKAGRDMWFYSFEDKSIKTAEKIIKKYGNKTVGDLVSDLFKVAGFFGRHMHPKKDLFTFLEDM